MKTILLWDAPTRLFHWTLVACVAGAMATGLIGGNWMEWHGRLGFVIAGLLAFRLIWGFAGHATARFCQFVRGPGAVIAYLQGRWQGIGHNPIGAFSVLGMLAVLSFQITSGLVANDDIAFVGPYNILVSKELETLMTGLHKKNFWLIALLIAAHFGAIAFYKLVKKDNLITPMLNGQKEVPTETPEPRPAHPVALLIAVAFALTVGWLAAGGIADRLAPPPPTPAATPTW